MKTKMILKKGMVFLFALMMALTGIFSLGVMAASSLEGAYISPSKDMGLEFANNFDRSVSKSQVSVPNFMADSDTNSEEPNKSFNAQQVAAGNSDAGAKWRGLAAYAKNHDPEDFWVRYKGVTTVGGKSVDLKIEVTDWKTQDNESKPLPSNTDMFGHDNNSAHLGYAIGFSYKKTGVVMFSGFKWVKFKYTFLYNGTNTKAPFTGFATFQDIDQNQYVTITDGMDNIVNTSYIGGSDGNTWCEPDGWTYKAIKDQNASSDQDSFDKTCISLYVKDMTDMSIKYGWTGHTAIAYFDLAPWAMNSFEENKNPDVPKKLIQNGSSWISNEKTSAVRYELGDTYSYRYEDSIPDYASDTLDKLGKEGKKAVSSYMWEDTLDGGLTYVPNSLQVNVGGKNFTSLFTDSSSGQNLKFSATSDALDNVSFYGAKITITFKVKIKDASYSWLGHERTSDNKYRLIPNAAKRSMKYLKKLTYDSKNKMYDVTDGDYGSASQDTSTVWSKVPIGDPNNPDPDPKKTVSDDNEKNVLSNTLTNADETFTYTVSKEIEKNMPSTAKYSKVVIKDDIDSCLTIDSVKIYAGDKDVTNNFTPTSASKGNYLEYAASTDLLNNKEFYGNNAGTTVKMVVKTHIDAKKVSIETLREHRHLVENDKKTETNIKIKNETTVTTTKADDKGTWDVDKKVTPPPTTTDSPIPSIKNPVKKVSDADDLNWDATVKQDGEKTPGSHNRVTDVTNQWLYTLTQEIPAHTVELFHYKSFTITDAVDSCLSYDVKDITIKAGDKDYTDKFEIKKGEDNSITLTAKADVLTSDEFYGGNAGNKIVVSFPVKISADAETL
ncbi:MAG: isopeptide-forming domain-containing fimbrial protein, partial [Anaerobutyricum soehngenii]|nr:isopeptide-forming domain-containing fimbrial protein [Anaerobutyricum soehngenii]